MPTHSSYSETPDKPLRRLAEISPNDTTAYDPPIILLYVGGTGNLEVQGPDGVAATIASVPAGQYVPGPFSKVLDTGSTATALVGWFNE